MSSTGVWLMPGIDAVTEADAHQPLNCEHSHHHHPGWQHVHGGPATHYVKAIHRCDGPGPLVYPACTPFAQYVQTMMFKSWICTHCKTVGEGRNMVQIVTIIESRTS